MKDDAAAKLAERIAQMISSENQSSDVASLFASLEKLNHRLEKLEAVVEDSRAAASQPASSHPSQERFAIAEAIVDSLFDHHSKEKACTFEPSKPCDHCSMCSSRGF